MHNPQELQLGVSSLTPGTENTVPTSARDIQIPQAVPTPATAASMTTSTHTTQLIPPSQSGLTQSTTVPSNYSLHGGTEPGFADQNIEFNPKSGKTTVGAGLTRRTTPETGGAPEVSILKARKPVVGLGISGDPPIQGGVPGRGWGSSGRSFTKAAFAKISSGDQGKGF